MPSALAVIALAERGTMFDPGPCVYMEKMAGGEEIADLLDLDRPLPETLKLIAERKGGSVGDVTVVMLDRPRHEEAMREVREAGARIRLITDGDVSAALLAVSDRSPVDLLWGIGGTPEGVLSAAALKSMGGELLGRLWPRNDEERRRRSTPATTSTASSPPTTSAPATTSSSPPPASPTATSCRASATAAPARPPSRWSCAPAPAPCAASTPATIAPSCARSSAASATAEARQRPLRSRRVSSSPSSAASL